MSTLTGTQVLLLVVSETGLVYTFTTVKLQPIVTKPEGKNLIQACLNAPDTVQGDSNVSNAHDQVSFDGMLMIEYRTMIQHMLPLLLEVVNQN